MFMLVCKQSRKWIILWSIVYLPCVTPVIIVPHMKPYQWFHHTRPTLLRASDGRPQDDHGKQRTSTKQSNRNIAEELAEKVRVLCWVMTHPANHEKKARHVKATWGKRCNILLFMSSADDDSLPAVKVTDLEGRHFLWGKTRAAFRYVYEHYREKADWFLKADDDTYVIVENLRYMLQNYSSDDLIYFGCRFNEATPLGYMSGGAGYVLSRASLEAFVKFALPTPDICRSGFHGDEDVEIGRCLYNVGVRPVDSRDDQHRGRFFPFTPRKHMFPDPDKSFWYWESMYYPSEEGLDCCSKHAISFHYIDPQSMYIMDYLIYELRPYGV